MNAPAEGMPRIAGVVLLRADGAALLQHRDDKPGLPEAGRWVFPGGHCEPGEPCREGARREFREETGYDCANTALLTEFVYVAPESGVPHWMSYWWADYDGVTAVHCYEGQAIVFITRAQGDGLPAPAYILSVWDQALAARREMALRSP
jgi:8-oxo-dGTP pyrophosphatase MutT (NUDIX family)